MPQIFDFIANENARYKRNELELNFDNPHATGYGGDIVTFLWFRPSVCPSRFDLVNMIETQPLCAYSSNLADMFTMTRG